MEKWYRKPLRAVTLEFPASDVTTIDVKGIVDEAYQGAVNTLNVFSIGYYPGGTAFYQSKLAPHYPGLGERDLLSEALDAAHANGQKVISYVASIWGDSNMYSDHPDWAQLKADGRVTSWDEAFNSVAMCPNSPFTNNWKLGRIYFVLGWYLTVKATAPNFLKKCGISELRVIPIGNM